MRVGAKLAYLDVDGVSSSQGVGGRGFGEAGGGGGNRAPGGPRFGELGARGAALFCQLETFEASIISGGIVVVRSPVCSDGSMGSPRCSWLAANPANMYSSEIATPNVSTARPATPLTRPTAVLIMPTGSETMSATNPMTYCIRRISHQRPGLLSV